MKLHIKTYLRGFIGSFIATCFALVLFFVFLFSDGLCIVKVFPCTIVAIILITGLIGTILMLKKMKRLKHLLKNGIHTKAVITKPYPLRRYSSFKELSKQEDESPNTILSYSIQYQFQTERGETITIEEGSVDGILQHLCVGSKIHILYDPDDEEKPLICPWWDEWIANNELYAYPKFITEIATTPTVGKQRHIPLFRFFSPLSLIITLLLFSFISMFIISLELQENVPTVMRFIVYGVLFLFLFVVYCILKVEQKFYEYAVQTVALVQRVETRTIDETRRRHHGKKNRIHHKEMTYTVILVAYQFLSSSEDNIFQGYCELQDTPEYRELKKGSEIEILYHAQRPYDSRFLTPKDKKYIY
ncbi:MAG TPA: hypothetical protein P5543_01120 [Planctomycetota bacterium]|nr:hypothetical protein [Planctomycetota bacterium]HRU50777.1 hypothetical protein [Planctomycetota bacterium]